MSRDHLVGRRITARSATGVIIAYQEPQKGKSEGFYQVRWDDPIHREPVALISTHENVSFLPEKDATACANCRFYSPGNEECRRHAPVPSASTTLHAVHWPEVRDGDWCGEFEREEP